MNNFPQTTIDDYNELFGAMAPFEYDAKKSTEHSIAFFNKYVSAQVNLISDEVSISTTIDIAGASKTSDVAKAGTLARQIVLDYRMIYKINEIGRVLKKRGLTVEYSDTPWGLKAITVAKSIADLNDGMSIDIFHAGSDLYMNDGGEILSFIASDTKTNYLDLIKNTDLLVDDNYEDAILQVSYNRRDMVNNDLITYAKYNNSLAYGNSPFSSTNEIADKVEQFLDVLDKAEEAKERD